jgi:hypothetical protein
VLLLFSDGLIFGSYAACFFIDMDVLLYAASFYGSSPSSEYYWLITNTTYGNSLMGTGLYWQMYVYAQFFSTGTLSTLAPGPFARNPIEVVPHLLASATPSS